MSHGTVKGIGDITTLSSESVDDVGKGGRCTIQYLVSLSTCLPRFAIFFASWSFLHLHPELKAR